MKDNPRIILIFPKSGMYGKIINDLPLSLIYASSIINNKGIEVTIIDQRVEKSWKQKLLYELQQKPVLAAISVMTGSPIINALEISKIIKKNYNKPVIWGGIHPTILPEQTLANPYIDIVVRGEGEETLLNLTNALINKIIILGDELP